MGGDDSDHFIKVGPAGYFAPNTFDEKGNTKVVQIFLSSYGEGVEGILSIQFQYYAENGKLVLSNRYGSVHHSKFDAVRLNYPTEYITGISGQTSNTHVRSIKFHTNLGEYGPFGQPQPTNPRNVFNVQLGEDHQFGGFHGTADNTGVKSIGIYLKPIMNLECSPKDNITESTDDEC